MTVKNISEAWQKANEIFPTDYEKDEAASNTAGYNIYRSRLNYYDYICDYILTIGLNDRVTEKQEISNEAAKRMISEILINKYGVFAFTMFDCYGVYKMNSTGRIIQEPSIRIEIATFEPMNNIDEIIRVIKDSEHLNQESIMKKHQISKIQFVE